VWVEAESNKIGNLHLPMELWHAMKAADGVELRVPVAGRTRHLLREYRHFTEQPDQLKHLIGRLKHRVAATTLAEWCADIDAGRWERFVSVLLEQHYDPAYRRSFEQNYPHVIDRMEMPDTGKPDVAGVVERLMRVGVGCRFPEQAVGR
jgi:tRNA 2-selenouridine synthase